MGEAKIIGLIKRQRWFRSHAGMALHHIIGLGIVLVPKSILLLCLSVLALNVSPFVSLGISLWRLVERDYGHADGDAANRAKLTAALDIFYVLILFQSIFVIYWACLSPMLYWSVLQVAAATKEHCGGENWSPKAVEMYSSETERKFRKDGELPAHWNLITYGVGLLQSASWDDHLWGARILDKCWDISGSATQELLCSGSSIQNLIGMIIGRGETSDNIEKRERATMIIERLASDLRIARFPGTLQCICSLLETCPSSEKNNNEQSRSLGTSQCQDGAYTAVGIRDQTDHEQEQVDSSTASAGLAQRKRTTFIERIKDPFELKRQIEKDIKDWRTFTYKSREAKELISQALQILERLTRDEENCTEISKHQKLLSTMTSPLLIPEGLLLLERLTEEKVNCTEISKQQGLLSKITSPLSSPDFLSSVRGNTHTLIAQMLSRSLTVVSRLLTSPGDGATRLRQELASDTEAVSNLMAILVTDREGAQRLHQQALEILTELAFDDSFKKLDFNKFFKALLRIFLEEQSNNNTVVQLEQADKENATILMGKAGEALARLLPVRTARERDANVADILSKQEAIDLLTKVLNQILSSEVGTTQGNENQSEERTFMAAMLSLAVVICNENVISKDDFAGATTEDEALAQKLKEVLQINKQCTAECLRTVKLTCQVVIAMIKIKPSCIEHFNEHNFREALTEPLETMSKVDSFTLFAWNDRELIKPARSLAFLVKEAQDLLNTAQEQGN